VGSGMYPPLTGMLRDPLVRRVGALLRVSTLSTPVESFEDAKRNRFFAQRAQNDNDYFA